jgi:hypothetical protein
VFLQAYPIIFTGVYGFNAGEQGLAFLPIGIGSLISCGIYLSWDAYLDRASKEDPRPSWYGKEEYRRVPLACLGAPLLSVSMFWLGWTAKASIHWIVPIIATIPALFRERSGSGIVLAESVRCHLAFRREADVRASWDRVGV